MKSCLCFLLLFSVARADSPELVAHYDLNINQPLRFEVFPNLVRFTWNLIGLAPSTIDVPVGWDTGPDTGPNYSAAPGYRLGDMFDLPVNSPGDQITTYFDPQTGWHSVHNRLTVEWSCENCYLTYNVQSPPAFTIPAGSLVTSGTATITAVGNGNGPAYNTMWGLAIDLYGAQVPEPCGMLVLLGLPLVLGRKRA
jgi:hypothetical protein